MNIPVSEAINHIDESGGHTAFVVEFYKADGSIRQMVATKRNRDKTPVGTAREGSGFKYQLSERNMLLLDELTNFKTRPEPSAQGTIHRIINPPNVLHLHVGREPKRPVSIRIFSIRSFNGNLVTA